MPLPDTMQDKQKAQNLDTLTNEDMQYYQNVQNNPDRPDNQNIQNSQDTHKDENNRDIQDNKDINNVQDIQDISDIQAMEENQDTLSNQDLIDNQNTKYSQNTQDNQDSQAILDKQAMLDNQAMQDIQDMLDKQDMLHEQVMLDKKDMLDEQTMLEKQDILDNQVMLNIKDMQDHLDLYLNENLQNDLDMGKKLDMQNEQAMQNNQNLQINKDKQGYQDILNNQELQDNQDIENKIDSQDSQNMKDCHDKLILGCLEDYQDIQALVGLEDSQDMQQLEGIEMEDANYLESFVKYINCCLVPKLAKNYDESEYHIEFDIHNNILDDKIKTLIEELEKYDFKSSFDKETTESSRINTIYIVSRLLNLYYELLCSCPWNTYNNKDCAKKLDDCFNGKCKVKLEDILKTNVMFDSQAVYDITLDELCRILTPDDFKKYPGQVEVYCELVQNCEDFDVIVNPLKILPVSLILIDDYIELNKSKGLLCCQVLLENLTPKDFENGNYYEVIYLSLKNALYHTNMKVTELSLDCSLELCNFFPSDIKEEKLDDMYTGALEHLSRESNLYRKASLLKYTRQIMQMIEIKCIGNSLFKTVICDAIEDCLNDSVAEVLLIPSLECLEEWIKYSWPVWNLPVDFKVLCALLKFYSKCNTGDSGLLVQKLIVTLVSLCTPEEQLQFTAQLAGKDEEECFKMVGLKKDIGVNTNLD